MDSPAHPDSPIQVHNLAQADAVLAELAELEQRLATIQADVTQRLAALHAEAAAATAPLVRRRQLLTEALHQFADRQRLRLFTQRRGLRLAHGALGFRRTTALVLLPRVGWQLVLRQIKEQGFSAAVRTREEVDKRVLRTWPEEQLTRVGVGRLTRDQFWCRPRQPTPMQGRPDGPLR